MEIFKYMKQTFGYSEIRYTRYEVKRLWAWLGGVWNIL